MPFGTIKGKVLGRSVYELLGGPQKNKLFCYASNTDTSYGTENSIAWFLGLGFKAVNLFLRHGPDDGLEGVKRSEELVARTREQVRDEVEIAVDAWMSLNTEYAVRISEGLRPYRIKWLEDYLLPEDIDSYFRVRQRTPWQTLATGEHWYSIHPFALAATHGLTVVPHASANYPYGQHLAYAMPSVTWAERSVGVSPPWGAAGGNGGPARDSGDQKWYLVPSDAPGFGLELTTDWLEESANGYL